MKRLKLRLKEESNSKLLVAMPLDIKLRLEKAITFLKKKYPTGKWSQNSVIVDSLIETLIDVEKDY